MSEKKKQAKTAQGHSISPKTRAAVKRLEEAARKAGGITIEHHGEVVARLGYDKEESWTTRK